MVNVIHLMRPKTVWDDWDVYIVEIRFVSCKFARWRKARDNYEKKLLADTAENVDTLTLERQRRHLASVDNNNTMSRVTTATSSNDHHQQQYISSVTGNANRLRLGSLLLSPGDFGMDYSQRWGRRDTSQTRKQADIVYIKQQRFSDKQKISVSIRDLCQKKLVQFLFRLVPR